MPQPPTPRPGAAASPVRGELAVAFDSAEARRAALKPQAHPTPTHRAVPPALHVSGDVAHDPDQVLDAVRRREEPPQRRPELALARLGHERLQVARFVQLAALDHGRGAEHVLQRPAHPPCRHRSRTARGRPPCSPRPTRSWSSSVQTTAFSVDPRRSPSGAFSPSRVRPRATISLCPPTTTLSRNSARSSSVTRHRLSWAIKTAVSRPRTVRLAALLLVPRLRAPRRARLQAAGIAPRRHAQHDLLQHPRRQRIPLPPRRHRGQHRLVPLGAPHPRARHLEATAAERQLPRPARPPPS